MPVVILAGGFGTRLREETEFRPKPMVNIGGRPILWHIMKFYASFGFYKFILCLGYKGEIIKEYFLNYHFKDIDICIKTKDGAISEYYAHDEDWEIILANTGIDCLTGSRVARVAQYISSNCFFLTYGDGLSDININALLDFHINHKKLVTLTGVKPPSRFGYLNIQNDQVLSFAEKEPFYDEWINGGFFVVNKEFIYKYLSPDGKCTLEQTPLAQVAQDNQLMAYKHHGFWQCMDTLREQQHLEKLWETTAPWKLWEEPTKFVPAFVEANQSQSTL
ncbi:glucose-1-phosphate cytidylyltransferase [Candidatus Dependentiae bacterium]|nr:glucose-1-phosphate cytidylyltransferase [Candidatus Dependentiae bacterium]